MTRIAGTMSVDHLNERPGALARIQENLWSEAHTQ